MVYGATTIKSQDTPRITIESFIEKLSFNQNIDNRGSRTRQCGGQAYVAHSNKACQENAMNNSEIGGFNKAEIKQLRNLLSSLENPSGLCSLACSGKYFDSYALSSLKDCF